MNLLHLCTFLAVCSASLPASAQVVDDPNPEQYRLEFRGVLLGSPSAEAMRALDLRCAPSKRADSDQECTPRKAGQTFANVATSQVRVHMLNGLFDQVEVVLPEKSWPAVISALKSKWGPHNETTRLPTWMINGARIYAYRTHQIMVVQMLSSEGAQDREKRSASASAKAAADL